MARRPHLSLILLVALAAAGGASAQDDKPKAKRRPIPVAKPAPEIAPRRTYQLPTGPAAQSLPPMLQAGSGFSSTNFASAGLVSGGLRSSLPPVGDKAAECRSACTQARLTCDAQDAAPECAPRWGQCVATCDR